MLGSLKSLASRLLAPRCAKLNPQKLLMIDEACEVLGVRSLADLGGVWNVDGGYSLHACAKRTVDRVWLVDTDFSEEVRRHALAQPKLTLLHGNFGAPEIAARIGPVDAVLLFDTLLHQVKPDWDQVLGMYAPSTSCFVIYNQQWTGPKTVRLLELGEAEYFRHVPHSPGEAPYDGLFARLDEKHPQHDRPWRDVHNIWQWGITNEDLTARLATLGFTQHSHVNCGRFGRLPNFENHAFVFVKK